MSDVEKMKKATEDLAQTMKRLSVAPYSNTVSAWRRFTAAAHADGELSRKHKELIAVAISIVKGCDSCISYHVRSSIVAGASNDEITEAAFVALIMEGGPALAHVGCVLDAIEAHRKG